MPSLSSFLPGVMPGVPFSMMNAEMPLAPAARSVIAIATSTSPTRPWVVNVFEPLRTQHSPDWTAVVRMPAASLPEVDSVRPHAPIVSPRASGTRYVLLLRLGAGHEDVGRAQAVVRGHRQRDGGIDARQLLDADAVVDGRHPRAAVLLGKLDAHQPERRRARGSARPENAALVPFARRAAGFRSRRTRAPCAAAAPALPSAGSPWPMTISAFSSSNQASRQSQRRQRALTASARGLDGL